MKSKLRIACAALLTATALPALALQLGEIQIKSALNQPLVAAIPLQPKNLTELNGLTVSLAPAQDFARAGLQVTPTDQTLQFHVVTDNNGQKLILVTSTQPITDPYLDFLVQVNTREGKQVREFVVLLNPVIAAPAPAVEAAPVASTPSASPAATQPAELPAPSQFPQPQPQPQPPPPQQKPGAQTAPLLQNNTPQPTPQAQPASLPVKIDVQHGDTLYALARSAIRGSDVNVDQMMLALKAANPDAFFKNNINNLKAGAILRIPTRDLIDQRSAAAAAAEVHRQYESWRAAKPHPATVVEGTAAQAAANAAPKPGNAPPASDHLTLVPPTGEGGGTNSRPGVAGGTGSATVAGLQQQLQANRDTLVSLNQSNSELESRVHSLQDISAKSDKLLSLKDATVAELQRKLAAVQSGAAAAPGASSGKANASAKAAASAPAGAKIPVTKPAAPAATPWYMRPLAWVIAGVIVLLLIVLGLSGRRRRPALESPSRGPLADPDDVSPHVAEPFVDEQEVIAEHPQAEPAFDDAHARAAGPETATDDPYGLAAMREPAANAPPIEPSPVREIEPAAATPATAPDELVDEAAYSDDPVDTKLDLARAYLDMGDPVGARAMLEEVLEEGTQTQKDEAKRLLAGAEA
ncbi:MAG TPA: FimV/HubP family polar landmark protein [Rhodanobacteraceae bacterium]